MLLHQDQTYRDLEDELLAIVGGLKGVENGRELLGVELDYRKGQYRLARYLMVDDAAIEVYMDVY